MKIIVIWLAGVSMVGCENFLQPEPESIATSETFFQNDDQFIQATDAAYNQLQQWVLQAHVLEEARSDNTHFDNGLNRGVLRSLVRIDWFVLVSDEPEIENAWNTLFTGIKDANLPLSKLEDGIQNGAIDSDLGQRLEGELKFLRAYFYFTAVRLWGNIPLILEPFNSGLNTFEITQSPTDEVYDAIIQDLQDAESLLPAGYDNANLGRATSGAAKAVLAKVHLWRGNYADAETKLREIINSNRYSLLADYSDIFDPQNKFNSEMIHEVPFKEGSEGESSNFLFQFSPVGGFPEVIPTLVGDGTWGKNLPTWQLVDAYDEDDERKEVSIGYFDPGGANVPYIKKWDEATDENFPRTNHNWPLIRYADVKLMLAEAINEQGYDTGEPFDLLNEIRDRAGLSALTPVDLPDQESFRQALLNERRFELAFENKRWYDLVRSGTAVETMRAHGEEAVENPSTPFTETTPLDENAFNVESHMTLYPIPENELILNPNMEQNPGY
ncbi:RagB/SusD family nutrient uptake outer membrane protein [Halalkalibaculum sp. DA3122]|uniref:RagB/SusD family nutrient uptake outer membrane protein n=1 Tax=unclassified Halalkalibaculum TaxID=2964617 RepID=UPI003754CA9B